MLGKNDTNAKIVADWCADHCVKCCWTRRGVRYITAGKQQQEMRDEERNGGWGVLEGEEDEWDKGNEQWVPC